MNGTKREPQELVFQTIDPPATLLRLLFSHRYHSFHQMKLLQGVQIRSGPFNPCSLFDFIQAGPASRDGL